MKEIRKVRKDQEKKKQKMILMRKNYVGVNLERGKKGNTREWQEKERTSNKKP